MSKHQHASDRTGPRDAYAIVEVARRLGVHPATVERRIAAGALPARRDGRRVLVLATDLAAYLEALPAYAPTGSTTTPPIPAGPAAEVARP